MVAELEVVQGAFEQHSVALASVLVQLVVSRRATRVVQDQVPPPLEESAYSKAVLLTAVQSIVQEKLTAFEEGPAEQRIEGARRSVE